MPKNSVEFDLLCERGKVLLHLRDVKPKGMTGAIQVCGGGVTVPQMRKHAWGMLSTNRPFDVFASAETVGLLKCGDLTLGGHATSREGSAQADEPAEVNAWAARMQ